MGRSFSRRGHLKATSRALTNSAIEDEKDEEKKDKTKKAGKPLRVRLDLYLYDKHQSVGSKKAVIGKSSSEKHDQFLQDRPDRKVTFNNPVVRKVGGTVIQSSDPTNPPSSHQQRRKEYLGEIW